MGVWQDGRNARGLVFDGWLTWPGTLLCRVRPECWDASRLLIDRSVRWLVGFVLHIHGDEAEGNGPEKMPGLKWLQTEYDTCTVRSST